MPAPIGPDGVPGGASPRPDGWWSLAEGRQIGYDPADDAERYADPVRELDGERETDGLLGADFCTFPLGRPR